jgi:hypothetical protein
MKVKNWKHPAMERVMESCAEIRAKAGRPGRLSAENLRLGRDWLEGRLRANDIERRATEFVRARFKSDHNKHGDLSLDVPIYIDGSATLLDRLSTETGSNYWST